jgi:repressor LexA
MLSQREQDAYDFIRDYIAEHQQGPLLDEIAKGLGIRSRGVAHRYVQTLADAGLLELTPGRHRGISLPNDSGDKYQGDDVALPLLGQIAAGLPIEAIPDQEEINLAEFFMGPNRFVLKVQGDSMIEAGIMPGDMVIVESRNHAHNGDIIVALIDQQEATLKRLHHNTDGSVTLFPANSSMIPVTYPAERIHIQGIVVGQMRSYR